MDASPPPPKRLLDQVRDAIRLKHYSYRTEQTYVQWIRRYILFHNKRHPDQMGVTKIEAFLTHLTVQEHTVLHRRPLHAVVGCDSLPGASRNGTEAMTTDQYHTQLLLGQTFKCCSSLTICGQVNARQLSGTSPSCNCSMKPSGTKRREAPSSRYWIETPHNSSVVRHR